MRKLELIGEQYKANTADPTHLEQMEFVCWGYCYPTEDAIGNPIDGFDVKAVVTDWENHPQYSAEQKMLMRIINEGGKWPTGCRRFRV